MAIASEVEFLGSFVHLSARKVEQLVNDSCACILVARSGLSIHVIQVLVIIFETEHCQNRLRGCKCLMSFFECLSVKKGMEVVEDAKYKGRGGIWAKPYNKEVGG